MKKIFIVCIILMVSVVFASCTARNYEGNDKTLDTTAESETTIPPFVTEYNIDDISYREGDFYSDDISKQLRNGDSIYNDDVLPDKESAVLAAKQIFDVISTRSDIDEFIPVSIFYDPTNKLWVVTFSKRFDESSELLFVGDGCSIALRQSDAQVVGIWFGE